MIKKSFVIVFLLFALCIGCFSSCGKEEKKGDIVLKCKNPVNYDDVLLDNILITENNVVYLEYGYSLSYEDIRVEERQCCRFEGIIDFSDNNKAAEIHCQDFGRCTGKIEVSGDGAEAYRKGLAARYQKEGYSEEIIKKILNNEYAIEMEGEGLQWNGYSVTISIEIDWESGEFEVIRESYVRDGKNGYDYYNRYYDGGRVPVKVDKNGKIITYKNEYYESGCVKTISGYDSEGILVDNYEYEDGEW